MCIHYMSNLVKTAETKKERNRLSAKKCRLNKKLIFEQLTRYVQELEQANNVLAAENAKLKTLITKGEPDQCDLLFDFENVLVEF
mgnify:CR=1 FL=1